MSLHYLRKHETQKLYLFSHAVYRMDSVQKIRPYCLQKLLKLVDKCRIYSKPKQCRFRDMVHSMTENTQFPGFVFKFPPGNAETLVRRGGITNHHSMAYSLSNIISAKNYRNGLMCVEVTVCNISVVF